MKISTKNSLIVVLCFATIPQRAFAYLDPGTGSMVLQLIVAGILGAIFTLKTWWRSIAAYVGKLFGRSSTPSE